jgi:hypothetical protein
MVSYINVLYEIVHAVLYLITNVKSLRFHERTPVSGFE